MLSTRPKTKIVCTLGPACASQETIEAMVLGGMSVARLNMSHGTEEEHERAIGHVRRASDRRRGAGGHHGRRARRQVQDRADP